MESLSSTVPWAGLAVGPAVWGLNTQLSYSLVPWTCGHNLNLVAPISGMLAVVAFAGAFISWRAWRTIPAKASTDATETHNPQQFLAGMGAALGGLFGLVIVMQGFASLILSACAR
jgi:hypothetical protein